jgi:formamidopyrimidine-DNA glycosylase
MSMPELPEVEAFRLYVATHCLDNKITDVSVSYPRILEKINSTHFKKNLTGVSFTAADRKGKYLIVSTSSKEKLVMHFGLTGFLVLGKPGETVRFSCVDFSFAKEDLHYCSVRKFGRIWLVDSLDDIKALKEMGPDPLQLSLSVFEALVEKNKKKNVKAFLMDQSVIAGIGNEYSDEILFQAGIDPHHSVKDLSALVIKKMYKEMRAVLTYAIKVRIKNKEIGTSRRWTPQEAAEFKSSYLQAHRHTDMLCPKNHNHKLKKVTIAGRSAYYCPVDQK